MRSLVFVVSVSSLLLTAYACSLPGSDRGQIITLSQGDIQQIVDAHNKEKINSPMATKGAKLYSWSTALQNNAATWARKCTFQHTSQSCRQNIGGHAYAGENLATGSKGAYDGMPGVITMINSWIAEKKDYSWGSQSCNGMCGHYTQIVWGDTFQVGCANVLCPSGTVLGSFQAYFLVCQYGPGGNYQGKPPATVANSGACASRPCGQGGLCTETGSTFDCACMNGFSKSGNRCNTGGTGSGNVATPPPDPCAGDDKCNGQGTCTNVNGKASCNCNSGFRGADCSEAADPCDPNPCQNGGTCDNYYGQFTCACNGGYSGDTCTTPPPRASGTPPRTGSNSGSSGSVPSQPPIVSAVFNGLKSRAPGRFNAQTASLQSKALQAGKSCGNDYDAGSSTMLLCGMETLDASDAGMYADMVIDAWAGFSEFWTVANAVGCVLDVNTDCGACDYGTNRPLTCAYGQSGELLQFVDHPMAWGKVRASHSKAMFSRPQRSHAVAIVAACGCFVFAAALVAVAIVYRRRQQQVQVTEAPTEEAML